MSDFTLDSLRAGYDDSTPISAMAKDACTVAENVEFYASTLGERRAGMSTFALPAGITGNAAIAGITWSWRRNSLNTPTGEELWVIAWESAGPSYVNPVLYVRSLSGWANIAFPSAADKPVAGPIDGAFQINAQALHGKVFLAYTSGVDRLHVYDGTSLRRVGIAAMAAPTVANTGAGAYAAVARFYRTRAVMRSGVVVLVRSEPSPSSASFTPSGAGTAARVTRAALPGESETDWEVEASADNVTFYKIATVVAGTTIYDDSAVVTTYNANPQSDPIGSYTLITSQQFLSSDDDRLLMANGSTFSWTPVGNDPLPGPDERINSNTDPTMNLDTATDGGLTGLSPVVNGTLFAFKNQHVYQLVRTGNLVGAYDAIPLTKARGALQRSLVQASDEAGHTVSYFIDPFIGPMRAGQQGLQYIGNQVRNLCKRINLSAHLPCHGVYYPAKKQLHWWLALDAALYPNFKIILQTDLIETSQRGDGVKCWTTVPSTDRAAYAFTSTMAIKDFGATTFDFHYVPYAGGPKTGALGVGTVAFAATLADTLQTCDTGTTDNGTTYAARVRTRPFFLTNILNRHAIAGGALLGLAGSKVLVKAIRDFGLETLSIAVSMAAVATETHVLAQLDNLNMSELFSVQFEFADDPANPTQWQLFGFAAKESDEQTA